LLNGDGNKIIMTLKPPVPNPLITDLTDGELGVTYVCDDTNVSHPALDRMSAGAVNFTVGYKDADTPLTIGSLTAGQLLSIITFTDTTNITPSIDVSDLVTLATAQGKAGLSDAIIDISSLVPLDTYIGKTIDDVALTVTAAWYSGTHHLVNPNHVTLKIAEATPPPSTDLIDLPLGSGYADSGPGLGYLITANSKLYLRIVITTVIPGASHTLVTSITAAKLAAAAVDQSQDGVALGTIDLTTGVSIAAIVDKTNLIGKTITSMSVTAASPGWSSSSDPIINASSSFGYLIGETVYLNTNLSPLPFSSGTLSVPFGSNDDIEMVFELIPVAPYHTAVTIFLSLSDIQANATLISLGVYSIDLVALGWDAALTPLLGKHVVEIETFVQTSFVNGSTIDLSATGSFLLLNEDNPHVPGTQGGVQNDLATYHANVLNDVDINWSADWTSTMRMILIPLISSNIDVLFPIDAATLQSLADAGDLASVSNTDAITHGSTGNLDYIGSPLYDLSGYAGYEILATNMVHDFHGGTFDLVDYNPAPFITGAHIIASLVNATTVQGTVIHNFASGMTLGVVQYDHYILTGNEFLSVRDWLVGTDTPQYYPITVTDPYELRQRNLPAFKLRFITPNWGELQPPQLDIYCFGSQGDTEGIDNSERYWTSIPMDILGGTDHYTPAQNVSSPLVVTVNSPITWLPENFGQSMLLVAKEYTGPYNYIMFVIEPHVVEEQEPPSYEGCSLEIIANAREVI